MVLSCHKGTGKGTLVVCKSSKCSQQLSHLPSPKGGSLREKKGVNGGPRDNLLSTSPPRLLAESSNLMERSLTDPARKQNFL